jgi:transcriptional regulator with XRE-family HTH domain
MSLQSRAGDGPSGNWQTTAECHDRAMDAQRFGRQFRALRIRLAKRQQDVADDARLSRSLIASVDRGQLVGVTLGALERAAAALGADLDVRLRWRGEALDRLLDEDHAAIVEAIVRRLVVAEWKVAVEVSFSRWGERGSIDVLGFHPAAGALVVVEVKSIVPDSQATNHGLDRKARLAPEIARERGWSVRHVSRLLVIGDTATSRRRVSRLASTYDIAFPVRASDVRTWMRDPRSAISGLLFVSYGSLGGIRRARRGRDRVRRPKPAQTAAKRAVEPISSVRCRGRADKAVVAVK